MAISNVQTVPMSVPNVKLFTTQLFELPFTLSQRKKAFYLLVFFFFNLLIVMFSN